MREQTSNLSESTKDLLHTFERLRDSHALHHAYCVVGPSKRNVTRVSKEIAAVLLSARKLPHTDCILFDCENDQSIESIRNFIQDFQSTPLIATHRIGLLLNFQFLTHQSQNALLKTLEEPPKNGIILCTANHARSLMPTILSRVALIRIPRVSRKELQELYKINQISDSLFEIQQYMDAVPQTTEEAKTIQEKIIQSQSLFSDFCKNPSDTNLALQTAFKEKMFNDTPISQVVHWWILTLLSEMKEKPSKQLRERNRQLIRALYFFLHSDLSVNMPLWLQSILAQYQPLQ